MADVKVSALTAASAAAKNMLIPVVQDPSGTPASRKLTVTQLFDLDDGTKTSSAPLINMAQTWNSGAVTFTAMKINVTNTASATNSLLMDLQVDGTSRVSAGIALATSFVSAGILKLLGDSGVGSQILNNGNQIISANNAGALYLHGSTIGLCATGTITSDIFLNRDDAGVLAQRNSTSAQTFRAYNTYTDASNYERGVFDWTTTANSLVIGTQVAGTGTARDIRFTVSGVFPWRISASGHFLAGTDNAYDIGASGAPCPRAIYSGADINAGAQLVSGSNLRTTGDAIIGSDIYFRVGSGGSLLTRITAPSDGVLKLSDNGQTTFDRLQFGGTTSSFPAIKRDGAGLRFVVADDSASADIECLSRKTGPPSGGTAAKWKGGVLVTAAVTPDTTRYIELDVAGTLYKVIVST